MTKEELKHQIQVLKLDKEFEAILFDLIDNAATVDQQLLNTVADLLDIDADLNIKAAQVFQEEAEIFETLGEELKAIDAEEYAEKLAVLAGNNKAAVEATVEQAQIAAPATPAPASTEAQDQQKIADLQSSLGQIN